MPSSARSTASKRPASARSSPSANLAKFSLRPGPFRIRRGPSGVREVSLQQEITFGTDGVRGVANKDLTPEKALRLGLAAAGTFGGPIVVGRDTRLSGGMLSCALAAGAASGGADVIDLGVLPTPGVAALAPYLEAAGAGVVSASHNPYPDNGIKFFSGTGRKLSRRNRERVGTADRRRCRETFRGRGRLCDHPPRRRRPLRRIRPGQGASRSGGREGAAGLCERCGVRGCAPGIRGVGRRPLGVCATSRMVRTSTPVVDQPT